MKAKLTFYLALVIAGSALLGVGEFFTIAGMILTALGLFLLLLLLDVDGIWWAITAAECFAFLISVIFLVAKRNKYHYM